MTAWLGTPTNLGSAWHFNMARVIETKNEMECLLWRASLATSPNVVDPSDFGNLPSLETSL